MTLVLRWTVRFVALAGFFLYELVLSNLRVALDVVSPRPRRRPAIVAVPTRARTDLEIALLANLVTLTPGTLSIAVRRNVAGAREVDGDGEATGPILLVHGMFVDDPDAFRASITDGIERRLLALLRTADTGRSPAP